MKVTAKISSNRKRRPPKQMKVTKGAGNTGSNNDIPLLSSQSNLIIDQ